MLKLWRVCEGGNEGEKPVGTLFLQARKRTPVSFALLSLSATNVRRRFEPTGLKLRLFGRGLAVAHYVVCFHLNLLGFFHNLRNKVLPSKVTSAQAW